MAGNKHTAEEVIGKLREAEIVQAQGRTVGDWFNLAGEADAAAVMVKNRRMTPQQIAEAQKLAANWKPKTWDELKRQMPR